MATVTSTEKIKLEFLTADGKDFSFSLDNPDKNVSEASALEKANGIIDANVFSVNGSALASVKGISIVKTEKTVYAIDSEE